MHPKLSVLPVGVVVVSLLPGCQLVEALVLDGAGQLPAEGICVTYQAVASDDGPVTQGLLEQTRAIVENRVDSAGVAEPTVVIQGADRISVWLPGVEDEADIDSIRELIGATGVVEFMSVPPELQDSVTEGPLPEGMLDTEPLFTGIEIASVAIDEDQTSGETVLGLGLKDAGSRIFDEYAADHLGERFAIVLDDEVITAPSINAPSFSGQVQISFDQKGHEAYSLMTLLRSGPLPLDMHETGFGDCEGSGPS